MPVDSSSGDESDSSNPLDWSDDMKLMLLSMPMSPTQRRPRSYIPPSPAYLTPSRSHFSWESPSTDGRTPKRRASGRTRTSNVTYSTSYRKVLKGIHPTMMISRDATSALDDFIQLVFLRISATAAELASSSAKSVISVTEVQTAVRLIFPAILAEHAISEGTKAIIT
ncbi:hypothetical protein D9611_011063 [Ephemerocybe angulata]|uniref:Core Histone H2A/H2B/H3 domain-containing protein n=1 Tax=Ephemerocybe angulata TaxID=980116 RepID=A0A8H5F146_9AGAR|nr:hypothetical protein D9611_011063 [Tulosesus angulatus]